MDPVYIAKAIWGSKRLVVVCATVGLGLAVCIAIGTPSKFVASAQILMDPRDLKVVANEVTPNGLPSEATLALIESQASVMTSANVLLRVVDDAKLQADPEFNGRKISGMAALLPTSLGRLLSGGASTDKRIEYITLSNLREHLSVSRETKSFVINLAMQSQDPEKAARIANMIANVFIDEQGRVQSDAAKRATSALSSRLEELRRSVTNAEQKVEAYKTENALIGVNGRLVDDQYIVQINDQLAKARGDITALRVKAASMRVASVEDVVRGTLPEEMSSQALVKLRQSYSDLANQSAMLSTKLGPRHPQRIASDSALASARDAIRSELGRVVAAAQTELARAEATERDLTGQIDALKTKQVTTSGAFVKLRELEREVEASRAVYEAFLLRARETSEQESLNTANVRVISQAVPPLKPSGLSRKTIAVLGVLLGGLAGIGLAGLMATGRLLKPLFAIDRMRLGERRKHASPGGTSAAKVKLDAAMQRRGADPIAPASAPKVRTAAAGVSGRSSSAYRTQRAASPVGPAGDPDPHLRPLDRGENGPQVDAGDVAASAPAKPAVSALAGHPDGEGFSRPPAHDDRGTMAQGRPVPPSGDIARPQRPLAEAFRSLRREFAAEPAEGRPLAEFETTGATAAIVAPIPDDRDSLRERIRALSKVASDRATSDGDVDPEIVDLQNQIRTVKQALQSMRRGQTGVRRGA